MGLRRSEDGSILLVNGDAVEGLKRLAPGSVSLVSTDPPWNTGTNRVSADKSLSYSDAFAPGDFEVLMRSFMIAAWLALEEEGTLAIQLDYRFAPYCAVWGDDLFGPDKRVGEIIVESMLGNPGKSRWPVKHYNITTFAKNPKLQRFHHDALPDIERRPGGLGARSKAGTTYEYGTTKKVASLLSATMSNTDPQRVGYPDQKPTWVTEALVRCYTDVGGLVVDPFAGSGTTGAACIDSGRRCVLMDRSPSACGVIASRLKLT